MKSKTLILIIILCLFLTYSTSPAYAVQLFTEYYGLFKVVEMTGIAILGSVVSVNAKDKKVTLLVKEIWNIKKDNPTMQINTIKVDKEGDSYTEIENVRVEIGKKLELNVYAGVEWTELRKSPIDSRLFGHLNFNEIKAGQEVIAAGFEFLPANKEILGRLDRVFSENFKSNYPKMAKKDELVSDLNDFDLAKIAFIELLDRKKSYA
ncbi:MAG: hypothetical protein H6625_02655 [Bdellovibrionaceae bacterium]|nr:hypothetical protein [Pseudobdellovibrionaceae bacterium]